MKQEDGTIQYTSEVSVITLTPQHQAIGVGGLLRRRPWLLLATISTREANDKTSHDKSRKALNVK